MQRGNRATPVAPAAAPWGLAVQAVTAALLALALGLRWQGSDLPAQLFRAELVRRHGLVLWNNLWYGGHPTVDYGVLTPVLGALTSPLLLAAVSCLVAAELFGRIVRDSFRDTWPLAALVFGSAAVVNLIVGRVPFALGLAFGLLAVRALQRDRPRLAALAGVAASAASPVAGAFVVLATVAWGASERRRRPAALAVAAITASPVAIAMLLYPEGGHFPLRAAALGWDLAVTALVAGLAWRTGRRTLVTAGALYGAACVAAFVVSSPLGGNVSRLGQFVAAPLVLAMVLPLRKPLFTAALVVPLVVWQWTPAVDAAVRAGRDPSTQAAYHEPLLRFLASRTGPPVRVEIPFTLRHWETTYVADQVPLARGWERQIDMARNPAFYDDTLTADAYHDWLVANGVGYVALADAPLDHSSRREAALLEAGVPGLEVAWMGQHWRVWRVTDTRGLVDGPAEVTALEATDVSLRVDAPGDLLVRVRWTGHWSLDGAGCVRRSPDGWTEVVGARPGSLVLSQALTGSLCDTP